MNALNKQSAKTMKALVALLAEEDYLKLDNKPNVYDPVHIEKVEPEYEFEEIYSLAHRYEMNGDFIASPLMTFGLKRGKFYPLSSRDDYSLRYYDALAEEVNLGMQKLVTEMANGWLSNIGVQQNIML